MSFFADETAMRSAIDQAGFEIATWRETSETSLQWSRDTAARIRENGPPPLGLHLLMDESAPTKLANLITNLESDAIRVIQAVVTRRD